MHHLSQYHEKDNNNFYINNHSLFLLFLELIWTPTPTVRDLALIIYHLFAYLIAVFMHSIVKIVNKYLLCAQVYKQTTVFMCSLLCLYLYRLCLFSRLLRSALFSPIIVTEVVSYMHNTVTCYKVHSVWCRVLWILTYA